MPKANIIKVYLPRKIITAYMTQANKSFREKKWSSCQATAM